jgi:hypothetical protein
LCFLPESQLNPRLAQGTGHSIMTSLSESKRGTVPCFCTTHRGTKRGARHCGRTFIRIPRFLVCLLALASVGSPQTGSAQNPGAPAAPPSTTATPAPDTAPPQDAAPSQDDDNDFVFKKEIEEVVLHATVVDDKNHPITGLARNNFAVYEDGKLQEVTSFRQERVPIALGILIDNSGSMLPKRAKVNDAALRLEDASQQEDRVFCTFLHNCESVGYTSFSVKTLGPRRVVSPEEQACLPRRRRFVTRSGRSFAWIHNSLYGRGVRLPLMFGSTHNPR